MEKHNTNFHEQGIVTSTGETILPMEKKTKEQIIRKYFSRIHPNDNIDEMITKQPENWKGLLEMMEEYAQQFTFPPPDFEAAYRSHFIKESMTESQKAGAEGVLQWILLNTVQKS